MGPAAVRAVAGPIGQGGVRGSEGCLGKAGVNVCLDILAALTDQCNLRLHRLACGKRASEPGLRAMG